MQKAQPTAFADTMEIIMNTPIEERMKKARSEEYFEAWKKVAERRAHLIFGPLPLEGPDIPEELKKEATDLICRVSWMQACDYMTAEEKLAACRAKRKEINEYAWETAKKAAAEQWKRVLAASK